MKRLTPQEVAEIRKAGAERFRLKRRVFNELSTEVLARKYEVSHRTIERTINSQDWSWVHRNESE